METKRQQLNDKIKIRYSSNILTENQTRSEIIYCGARENAYMHISANGEIFPCVLIMNIDKLSLGNVKERSLIDIWKNSSNWRFWSSEKNPEQCDICQYVPSCRGGCRAYAYYLTGDINQKDPRCKSNFLPLCPCYIYPPIW